MRITMTPRATAKKGMFDRESPCSARATAEASDISRSVIPRAASSMAGSRNISSWDWLGI
jgi:hypothetical protein